MKARVKATGEIVEVMSVYDDKWQYERIDTPVKYSAEDLDFSDIIEETNEVMEYQPDYWDKLLHQYAGMAMQGMLESIGSTTTNEEIAEYSYAIAHALVEKMKEVK